MVVLPSMWKGPFLPKSMGQICPLYFILLMACPHGLENNHAWKWFSEKFSRNNKNESIPQKLSEVHLHAWLFSNPCGKVLIIVGISWSLDLRVKHTHWLSLNIRAVALKIGESLKRQTWLPVSSLQSKIGSLSPVYVEIRSASSKEGLIFIPNAFKTICTIWG